MPSPHPPAQKAQSNSASAPLAIGMVAGETSGDLIGGLLLHGLTTRNPRLTSVGIGGPAMVQQGFTAWWPHTLLSLMGFGWDVLKQIRKLLTIRHHLERRLANQPIHLFIGIDSPDFNLSLEKKLKARGIKTIHYICPSIWAWREGRIKKLKAACDHVLCVFPFEPDYLAGHGIAATFVGHPLAEIIPLKPNQQAARAQLGLPQSGPVLALLPGSRTQEVKRLGHVFFKTAKLILEKFPDLTIVVPTVAHVREKLHQLSRQVGFSPQQSARLMLLNGQSHRALEACDLTLIASGTATLEAALYKRPMVVAYKLGWGSALLYRYFLRTKQAHFVSLPNILLKKEAVPELLQTNATPKKLAAALESWLHALKLPDSPRLQQLEHDFLSLHHSLLCDTQKIACHAIEQVLES